MRGGGLPVVGASAVWDKPVTPTCLFAVSGVCGVWSVVLCSDDRTWRAGLGSVFLSFCLSGGLCVCLFQVQLRGVGAVGGCAADVGRRKVSGEAAGLYHHN